ncbi:MAG: lipocalin-like domain-containing protein [Candidatus Omnitrophica bacterium]|nr:lipocalin-like domain-containing protein [Candidatus Omnitrophota bacterium]
MDRFIGTWRLISFEMKSEKGDVLYPFGKDSLGYIMYNHDGYMSVNFMKAGRPLFASPDISLGNSEEKASAMDTYISYCGKYEVDGDQVVHHIEVSWFPNWSGIDQVRYYEFSGNRLTLKTPPVKAYGESYTGALVWERVEPHRGK